MRCEHHPGVDATATCEICEIPICGVCSNYTTSSVLCDRCVNTVAMSDLFAARAKPGRTSRASAMSTLIEEGKSLNYDNPEPSPKRKPHSRIWDTVHGIGIFACFVFIGIQVYTNFGAGEALSPAQIAAEERLRSQIEDCSQVFWEIAELLRNGQEPTDSLRCPFPGTPNIIARVDDDIIVRHPSPQLLGYSDIFVSKSNPVPVMLQ